MKTLKIFQLLTLLIINLIFISCNSILDSKDSKNDPETLSVKFTNSSSSKFTITDIQLMAMGKSGEAESSPSGEWSENILTDDKTIAPGEFELFDLEIPKLHWSQYRLGVIDENGNHIMLHEQEGYSNDSMMGSITYWGSDERSVNVTVVRNSSTGLISISGYGDWAGID